MANSLIQDPIYLDTAHASNVVVQGARFLYAIKVVCVGGAGSAIFQVKSTAIPWFQGGGAAAAAVDFSLIRLRTPGDLILVTLTNAVVYVYQGEER